MKKHINKRAPILSQNLKTFCRCLTPRIWEKFLEYLLSTQSFRSRSTWKRFREFCFPPVQNYLPLSSVCGLRWLVTLGQIKKYKKFSSDTLVNKDAFCGLLSKKRDDRNCFFKWKGLFTSENFVVVSWIICEEFLSNFGWHFKVISTVSERF